MGNMGRQEQRRIEKRKNEKNKEGNSTIKQVRCETDSR